MLKASAIQRKSLSKDMNFLLKVFIFTRLAIVFGETADNSGEIGHANGSLNIPPFYYTLESLRIVHIDPETLIKFDNKGERMMGIANDHCDNTRVYTK